jgi:hypothetical protein
MKIITFDLSRRRLASIIVAASMVTTLMPEQAALAANQIETVVTDYVPAVSESIDASGFRHPGQGFTKEMLENVQAQVRAQQQPWTDYFNAMSVHKSSLKNAPISNTLDGTTPRNMGIAAAGANGSFIADGLTVYAQAIMYLITGDETYRYNGMRILRI